MIELLESKNKLRRCEMEANINLVTIWTNDIVKMKCFYSDVLGFKVKNDLGNYVEFENAGVRFAICMRDVMYSYSSEYKKKSMGQSFELALLCEDPNDVDETFKEIVRKGATPIQEPKNMPWNQRTALFADVDGNIHEIFAEII